MPSEIERREADLPPNLRPNCHPAKGPGDQKDRGRDVFSSTRSVFPLTIPTTVFPLPRYVGRRTEKESLAIAFLECLAGYA